MAVTGLSALGIRIHILQHDLKHIGEQWTCIELQVCTDHKLHGQAKYSSGTDV